jgi:hypothetical protein
MIISNVLGNQKIAQRNNKMIAIKSKIIDISYLRIHPNPQAHNIFAAFLYFFLKLEDIKTPPFQSIL